MATGLFFLYRQNGQPPLGWHVFRSEVMNFSFRYPEPLVVTDHSEIGTSEDPVFGSPTIFLIHQNLEKDYRYNGPDKFPGLIIYEFEDADFALPQHTAQQFNNMPTPLTADQRVKDIIHLQGQAYALIDYGDFDALSKCDSNNNCVSALKRTDGTYLTFQVLVYGGTIDEPDPALDSSNPDYLTMVEVLKTLKF